MAKPPGFDEWIKIANETGKTREEREKLRADVYRRYGMKPPSDRGGIAGIWDRNKQIIKPVVQTAAGFVGGPKAGAVVGSLMEGLDRPGQRGVGFDVKAGIRGGVQGYGMGQLGSAVPGSAASRAASAPPPMPDIAPPMIETALPKSVLDMGANGLNVSSAAPAPYSSARGMLAGGDTDLVAQAMQGGRAMTAPTGTGPTFSTMPRPEVGIPRPPEPDITSLPAGLRNTIGGTSTGSTGMDENLLQRLLSGASGAVSGAGNYLSNMKPEVLQGILQGGGTALGAYLERGTEQQRIDFLREQQRMEQERANRLARMLMPMAQAQGQMVGAQYGSPPAMG